jgi:quercetin dioxygenase-like cupin family protein
MRYLFVEGSVGRKTRGGLEIMKKRSLIVILAFIVGWSALGPAGAAEEPLDVSVVTSQIERFHDTNVRVRGVVAAVGGDEGAFIDVVPVAGAGEGVLVSLGRGSLEVPKDGVGRIVVVSGTFYSKVYPSYRLEEWHNHGWRASETSMPRFARVFRMQADSVRFAERGEAAAIREAPLEPYTSPLVDLNVAEFEAARMGTGKKWLDPGAETPEHSTGRYHELLLGIEGELTVHVEGASEPLRLVPGTLCYVPPNTAHSVTNASGERGCYIFVYSLPDRAEAPDAPQERSHKHGH